MGDGVEITGAGTTGNTVAGNYIGTDETGTYALSNYAGVEIDSGASSNVIGTNGDGVSDALERNIVSGNLLAGVWMTGTGTDNNVVAGNYIGTDVTGTFAIGNGSTVIADSLDAGIAAGVVIEDGASGNLVGTTGHSADDAGQLNVISGNLGDGVDLYASGTSGNVVAGNYIGTNATGTAALGNAGEGVYIPEVSATNWVGLNSVYGAGRRRPGQCDFRQQRERPGRRVRVRFERYRCGRQLDRHEHSRLDQHPELLGCRVSPIRPTLSWARRERMDPATTRSGAT